MEDLLGKKCKPCEGGVPRLREKEISIYFSKLASKWDVRDNVKIRKIFKFKGFKEAMEFVDKVAMLAEKEGHHPDLCINYNKVSIELTTHAIKGLSENDFIVAAKIENIYGNKS